MRKEKIIPMISLVMFLVAVLALPQGFAKTTITKGFGNRPSPPVPVRHQSSPVNAHQSGNGLLTLSNNLLNNHQYALEFMDGSGNVAFATAHLSM
jgi:hypothetical protein